MVEQLIQPDGEIAFPFRFRETEAAPDVAGLAAGELSGRKIGGVAVSFGQLDDSAPGAFLHPFVPPQCPGDG